MTDRVSSSVSSGKTSTLPAAVQETLQIFWESPFPATLQGKDFRIVDVNDAFVEFSGFARSALIGHDPMDMQHGDDRAAARERRKVLMVSRGQTSEPALSEGRIIDARGFERWYRAARRVLADEDGAPLYFAVLQDTTLEHAARERADRSVRELDDWFHLSPVGMVLFDDSGLLVRTNPAFDHLAGSVPVSLAEGAPELARLLSWGEGGALRALRPGSHPVESQGWIGAKHGPLRRLRAIVRCYRTASGERRYMGIVEDRSAEEERDLARMQIGAMMDTASVGIATFEESSGWVRQQPKAGGSSSSLLQNISRDIVAPESLAEFERLQTALRRTQRAEVRFRVIHPELGQRWLLTRVEPATLASGKKTASVVTLDVTDQQMSQRRSEQLLREMTTILESATAGIAYLRGGALVRCNRRFESMLRLPPSAVAGSSLAELLSRHPDAEATAAEIREALIEGRTFETEFVFGDDASAAAADGQDDDADRPRRPDGFDEASASGPRWYSLSVRRAGGASGFDEAIAVLSDVTRLKTQQVQLESLALERELMAERTRSILDSVLVGIVTVGHGGIEWMNRSARRMFGGDLADFIGEPMALVATDDAQHPFRLTRYLDDLVEGQAETFECQVRGLDGREFWVVGNAVATGRDLIGRQLTFALLDIERRRQAEAAVSAAQASLRRVIEAAPLAIALLDARTLAIVQVNGVAASTVHSSPDMLVGLTLDQIFPPALAAERTSDLVQALGSSEVTTREYRFVIDGVEQVWDARLLPLAAAPGETPDQILLVATDVTEQRAAQEARLEAAIAQREMLVREVHHRIKNNLQGVAGLLQQIAGRKPEVAAAIDEVVGQVQAIAQVYGLQVGADGPLSIVSVLEAITGSVQRTFGRPIRCSVAGSTAGEWSLPEVEAIPIALTLNELLTNAIKHSSSGHEGEPIGCALECGEDGVHVAISSRARLPTGFSLARIPNGVSGLGLVRALLPRRSAELTLEQTADIVVATVSLSPPGVQRIGAA
jgi:PAS domain S-box-containing protein